MNRSETQGSPRAMSSGVRRWIAALRQLGLPGHARIQDLPIGHVAQDNVGFACEQSALGLTVECREITLLQRLGRGQRPQRGDHAGKLPVEIAACGASDLERGAILRGSVGRAERDNAECGEQKSRQNQGPAEREQVGP